MLETYSRVRTGESASGSSFPWTLYLVLSVLKPFKQKTSMNHTYMKPTLVLISLCCISVAAAIGGNETDHQTLLELKKQITDDPFGVMSSWNASIHFCQWFGVRCGRRHQRVTVLDLSSQKLSGRMVPEIGNMSFLRELYLQNNSFSNEIPSEMGRLRRLELLDLRNNSLSGQIPSNLSRCTNLILLALTRNHLVSEIPSEFGDLSNLQNIRLSYNSLTGSIPASLGNLTLLEKLFLSFNPLSGTIPKSLGQLKNLKAFIMEENQLSGSIPSSIFNLSLLTELRLPANHIEGTLPPDMFITLPYLQHVIFDQNKHLTGPIPISMSNASNLNYFSIGENEFNGRVPSFQKLDKLTGIHFYTNNLGTRGLDGDDLSFLCTLRNSTKMQILAIGHNDFGGNLPNCIGNLSFQLQIFELDYTFISGRPPNEIGNLLSLTRLSLSYNLLSGTIPVSIGALWQLKVLYLDENKLSGEIPNSLGNLTSLIYLFLGSNNLQGSIPPIIGSLESLLQLDLSQNSFSGTIPTQLMTFPLSLLSLDLSGNNLTGSVPSEVGKLANVGGLYFSNNMLTGEIPSSIGSCTSLESLDLSQNFLQGDIPSTFVSLRGIVEIDLSQNNLSGELPMLLGSFNLLKILNLSYNDLEGMVPVDGVFKNRSAIFLTGNRRLCGGIPELKLPRCKLRHKRKVSLKLILVGVCAAVLLGLSLLVLFVLLFLSRRKSNKLALESSGQSLLSVSYQSLLKATNDFSSTNLIGVGHFGSVFRGTLGQYEAPVAVKVLNPLSHGAFKSFATECEALKSIRHRNLVKILTVCSSIDYQGGDFKALVYEFMANGSLEEWLHPVSPSETEVGRNVAAPARMLGFLARINIAIDVASALEYLHIHCQPPIGHCDVKPSNILLDEDMTARVGDFGLARIFQEATSMDSAANQTNSSSVGLRGTIGYAPPEYGVGSQVSTHGDVYSFGILLLEIFTGKRPTANMFNERLTLHNFVRDALPRNVIAVSDATMLEDEEISNMIRTQNAAFGDCLNLIFEIAIACSATVPRERKRMDVAVAELIGIRDKFVKQIRARLT